MHARSPERRWYFAQARYSLGRKVRQRGDNGDHSLRRPIASLPLDRPSEGIMASGQQLLVLQACNDLPGDSAGFVDEAEIAARTRLQLRDVRDCIAATQTILRRAERVSERATTGQGRAEGPEGLRR